MSIKLTPLEDKIIVKQAAAETQTASGLFIPDNAKEKPQQGDVLPAGPGRRADKGERNPMDAQAGDKVLYSKSGGTEVHSEGEDYLILGARDMLAILGGLVA
ncbi:co-chaperone GroES [Bifidobacterium sp.]|uniref:co-chaperone GroES n=1 Tax=Bifidobacterium sp. TaxID=41200 RepID=UPI0028405A8E|nr:co-chaperone GroES [Bifidobacterium sp.]MDR4020136.1 co-chaperone GroES [Bifidobacterium sp.]